MPHTKQGCGAGLSEAQDKEAGDAEYAGHDDGEGHGSKGLLAPECRRDREDRDSRNQDADLSFRHVNPFPGKSPP